MNDAQSIEQVKKEEIEHLWNLFVQAKAKDKEYQRAK